MISVEIPAGIQIEISGSTITTKGSLGSNTRTFNDALIVVTKDGNSIKIDSVDQKELKKKAGMAERSIAKEIKNDIDGVEKHFEINMTVIFAHFPITVEAKGDKVVIKNLIGERGPRYAKIVGTTKVEIKGSSVRLFGTSRDDVSQTGANIRTACRIPHKDSRIFQDGLYYAIE